MEKRWEMREMLVPRKQFLLLGVSAAAVHSVCFNTRTIKAAFLGEHDGGSAFLGLCVLKCARKLIK